MIGGKDTSLIKPNKPNGKVLPTELAGNPLESFYSISNIEQDRNFFRNMCEDGEESPSLHISDLNQDQSHFQDDSQSFGVPLISAKHHDYNIAQNQSPVIPGGNGIQRTDYNGNGDENCSNPLLFSTQ